MRLLVCIESSEVFCRHLPDKWLRGSESGHGALEPWPGDQTRAEKSRSIRRLGVERATNFKARHWVPPSFHLKGTGQRGREWRCMWWGLSVVGAAEVETHASWRKAPRGSSRELLLSALFT